MKETEWLECQSPGLMLDALSQRRSDQNRDAQRRLRLLGVAACRRMWNLLGDPSLRLAVEKAEEYADGRLSLDELFEAAQSASQDCARFARMHSAARYAGDAVVRTTLHARIGWSLIGDVLQRATWAAAGGFPGSLEASHRLFCHPDQGGREQAVQCDLIRDLYGNLFRPAVVDPLWRTWQNGLIIRLAGSIYAERRWDDLPVLGDALEEAGCTSPDILDHCRGRMIHARGCWLVDALRDRKKG
jgi:hypothetical protein